MRKKIRKYAYRLRLAQKARLGYSWKSQIIANM